MRTHFHLPVVGEIYKKSETFIARYCMAHTYGQTKLCGEILDQYRDFLVNSERDLNLNGRRRVEAILRDMPWGSYLASKSLARYSEAIGRCRGVRESIGQLQSLGDLPTGLPTIKPEDMLEDRSDSSEGK